MCRAQLPWKHVRGGRWRTVPDRITKSAAHFRTSSTTTDHEFGDADGSLDGVGASRFVPVIVFPGGASRGGWCHLVEIPVEVGDGRLVSLDLGGEPDEAVFDLPSDGGAGTASDGAELVELSVGDVEAAAGVLHAGLLPASGLDQAAMLEAGIRRRRGVETVVEVVTLTE
jgi:hypothetical protein